MLFSLLRGQLDFGTAVVQILAILVIIFLILPFHEWAHAFSALKLGDTSIKYRGRLSLNPVSHIDPFGALCLLLFGFGWAKPVPVDARNFKNPKVGMAICAFAGPLANFVAALAGALILNALACFAPMIVLSQIGMYVIYFLQYYITVNISLAVFNLIPIPPLDGSKVLFALLPDKIVYQIYQYERYFFIILYVLLFSGVLSRPLSILSNLLLQAVEFLAGLPFLPFS